MPPSDRHRITVFFITILAGSWTAEGAEIRFKPQADVRGSLVLLGDIAEVLGTEAETLDSLRRIELFPSPARGRVREVRNVELRQLLQLHGVNAAEHRFTGAESIRIAHRQTKLSVPSPATPVVHEEDFVVFVKRSIGSGELLRAVDLELRAPDKPLTGITVARSVDQVLGQESVRDLSAGQPLDLRVLRKPVLVKRGDIVEVTAQAAGVRVQTYAKALGNGTAGDLIQLESQESRKTFSASVSGFQQATVLAGGATVSSPSPAITSRLGESR